MGQRMVPFCDVCGTEDEDIAFKTVTIDKGKTRGQDYCTTCWDKLLAAIEPFIAGAKPVKAEPAPAARSGDGRRIAVTGEVHTPEEREQLKAWCEERGVRTNGMGRTAAVVWQAFYDDDVSQLAPDRFVDGRAVA